MQHAGDMHAADHKPATPMPGDMGDERVDPKTTVLLRIETMSALHLKVLPSSMLHGYAP